MVQYPVGNVAFYYYTVSDLHRDSSKGLFSRPEPPNKFEKINAFPNFFVNVCTQQCKIMNLNVQIRINLSVSVLLP